MKGVSGIVATAILLALTVAGGVLIYTYVTRYLNTVSDNGKLVVENAYYLNSIKRLTMELRNIGTRDITVNNIEVVTTTGKNYLLSNSNTTQLPTTILPGELKSIEITWNITELPRYIVVKYNDISTEPVTVRIIG
ncbi:MAG: archaellin/type IV pilin N-terminal domain-containing protein [Desulfurococcaceae archaeon]